MDTDIGIQLDANDQASRVLSQIVAATDSVAAANEKLAASERVATQSEAQLAKMRADSAAITKLCSTTTSTYSAEVTNETAALKREVSALQDVVYTKKQNEAANKLLMAQTATVGRGVETANKSIQAFRGTLFVLGSTVAPQTTTALLATTAAVDAVRTAAALTGTSLLALGSGAVIAGGAIIGTVAAWNSYAQAQAEAKQSAKDWADQDKRNMQQVTEELRILGNMGLVNQSIEQKVTLADLKGGSNAALRAVREVRQGFGLDDNGVAAKRREFQAELLDGAAKEQALADIALTTRLKEIELLDRKVKLTREESKELRDLAMKVADYDALKIAQEAKRRFDETKFGLQAELAGTNAELTGGPNQQVNPNAWQQAQLASEEATFRQRMNMIGQLGLARDKARELEILAEQNHQAKILKIDKETAELKRQVNLKILDNTSTVLGGIADAARMYGRKGFEVYKAFAIAEATISTFSSAQKAYDSTVGIPYVGPILAPIAAAAAIAAGVARVAQIESETPAYSTGGIVPGEYNGKDDRMIMVGPGEAVLTPQQQRMIGMEEIYSAIESTGGKLPGGIRRGSIHFDLGGIVTPDTSLAAQAPTNFNVGLINNRQEEREWMLRQGTRIILNNIEQRRAA